MSGCTLNLSNLTVKGLKDYPEEPTPEYPE
jgi:hypothetical protein